MLRLARVFLGGRCGSSLRVAATGGGPIRAKPMDVDIEILYGFRTPNGAISSATTHETLVPTAMKLGAMAAGHPTFADNLA